MMIYLGTTLKWDKKREEAVPMPINGVFLEEWEGKHLGLFKKSRQNGQSEVLKSLKVCHKEINWKINPANFFKANIRATM